MGGENDQDEVLERIKGNRTLRKNLKKGRAHIIKAYVKRKRFA